MVFPALVSRTELPVGQEYVDVVGSNEILRKIDYSRG